MNLGFTAEELATAEALVPDHLKSDVPSSNIAVQTADAIESCRTSLDFLAATALPEVFKYFFPPLYLTAWNWLISYAHKERDFSQLALGLPRGFAKTTFVKIFLLYCILFTKKKFLLVFSENQSKAINIISDVINLLSHSNIVNLFGNWKLVADVDRQELKKFVFRGRQIILMAGTVETSRGLNLNNERPDVMIFDDIQSRSCAESAVQSENLEREMIGTAMKAKSPHGCLFIFIGNMYPTKHSILKHLKRNKNWIKFIVGGILEDGTSLWEELQPIKQLLAEFQNDIDMNHPEIFYAEVLNDENATANNLIDLSKLPDCKISADDIPEGKAIIIDPSGNKSASDDTAIGYFEYFDAKAICKTVIHTRLSPMETIHEAIKLALVNQCPLVAIESVGYQATLAFWFTQICTQMQIEGIQCVEIHPGSYSKNSRILQFLKSYKSGEIFAEGDARTLLHTQIMEWKPSKRDNTDGILDLMTYAPRVYELYSEYMLSANILNNQEFESLRVPEHNSPF